MDGTAGERAAPGATPRPAGVSPWGCRVPRPRVGVPHVRATPGGALTMRWAFLSSSSPVIGLTNMCSFSAVARNSGERIVASKARRKASTMYGGTSGGAAKPAQIDRNGVLILVRSSLLALDHANKTGNYTVLRELGSPQFQMNTDARLAEIFAQQKAGLKLIDGAPLKMVNEIGAKLTQGSVYRYQFHVAVDKSVNAYAMPGGYIVVHTGLLALVVFSSLAFVSPKWAVLMAVGLTPFVALSVPQGIAPNIERRGQAFLAGANGVASSAKISPGVSSETMCRSLP